MFIIFYSRGCIYGWNNNVYYYYATYYHCAWSRLFDCHEKHNPFGQTKWFYGSFRYYLCSYHLFIVSCIGNYIYSYKFILRIFDYKILGACYLIYLGVQSIRSARQSMNFNTGGIKVNDVSCFTSYRQGFLSTILNPKALLYYVSVLPQFLSTGGIEVKSQVAILSLAVIMIILIWFYSVYLYFNILNYYSVSLK